MASSTTTATLMASTSAAAGGLKLNSNLKVVGIILAVVSGFLIGSSFVFKKKGLLSAQAGQVPGQGVQYLKSPLWWTGMIMMILGELCNFAAYAFVEALVVTPLGALSVVICAIMSSIFLKEKLSFFGWLGCGLCIVGSIIIALNGPQEASIGQIVEFQHLFLAPGFLVFIGCLIIGSLVIIFYFAPKYGKDNMLWYIAVCSMIGGISVSVTTGLGGAIVTTAQGDNQFKHWFIYFLLIFVVATLLTEVYYLNVALALFNTALVTPTYYVLFSFCSMVTTVVLFQGLKATVTQIITIVLAFLVICAGITILQMSKVDPRQFKLDRRSTMLLQAAKQNTEQIDEKDLAGVEEPGIDAIRGSFGPVGSVIRARTLRKLSQSTKGGGSLRSRHGPSVIDEENGGMMRDGMRRTQLYDAPVPRMGANYSSELLPVPTGSPPERSHTIKFENADVVHQYRPTSSGQAEAIHERRSGHHDRSSPGFPPVAESEDQSSRPGLPKEDVETPVPNPFEERQPSSPRGPKHQREKSWGKPQHGRLPSQRGYPLNAGDDDKEESVSLVDRHSDDSENEPFSHGGIRLVSQAPR